MKRIAAQSLLLAGLLLATMANSSVGAGAYRAGLYTASTVDSTCFSGAVGSRFHLVAWVQTPDSLGLRYVTLRLVFPDNLRLLKKLEFCDQVVEFIATDYVDGTVEWNMILRGCPVGWVRVFQQEVELLDSLPSVVEIHGGDSWIRDCDLGLYRVEVTNEILLNSPDCKTVPVSDAGWSALKLRYD